jgi:hypothetical protein
MSKKPDTDKSKGQTAVDMSQTAPDAAIDPFVLERVYPDPAPLLQAHKVPSANEKSVLVALDTSALLLPYQIKSGNLTEVGKAFDRLFGEQRLFVPGRVVREFTKHRDEQLANVIGALNKRRAGFSGEMPPLLGATSGYGTAASAYSELEKAQKNYAAALDELVSEIRG